MANPGRSFLVKKAGSTIAAVKQKSITINNEAIDTTNDDDDGWRSLMNVPGVRSIDMSLSGVAEDDDLRNAALSGQVSFDDFSLEWPDGATLTGTFVMASYEESGETGTAIEFSCSLQLSGVPAYTPAA